MKSLTPPQEYFSQEDWALEKENIFSRLWVFAGLRQQVRKNNQFFRRSFQGVNIILQNTDGKIRAFENACVHRRAELQWEDAGCRPLYCRYHGWSYDGEGKVRNIPLVNSRYCFASEEVSAMRLREFKLVEIGDFLFISLADEPPPIENQIPSKLLDSLRDVSLHLDEEVIWTKTTVQANWKLCFANNFDSEHVHFLHKAFKNRFDAPEEDHPLDSVPRLETSDSVLEVSYKATIPFKEEASPKYEWHPLVDKWGGAESAHHIWCLYPSLEIYSSSGYMFGLHHFNPVGPDVTEILTLIVMTKKLRESAGLDKETWAHLKAVILWQHMAGDRDTALEDLGAAEHVQKNFHPEFAAATVGVADFAIERLCHITRRLARGEVTL